MSDWAPKRFWTVTNVRPVENGFEIALDDRVLTTPGRTPLVLPTDAMAQLVAAEWEAQIEKVDPTAMPFTRMANSAIDRIGAQRPDVVDYIVGYAETDLLCYRAKGPAALIERQRVAWDPMLDWASEVFGARLIPTEGIMPIAQDQGALAKLSQEVEHHDDFGLMGLHDLVSLTGSLILGLAAARNVADAKDIWTLSLLDENWQIEQWGEDLEAANVASRKAKAFLAAHRFFHSAR